DSLRCPYGCDACVRACSWLLPDVEGLVGRARQRTSLVTMVPHIGQCLELRRGGRRDLPSPLKSCGGPADGSHVSETRQSVIPLLHALASTGASDLHCK